MGCLHEHDNGYGNDDGADDDGDYDGDSDNDDDDNDDSDDDDDNDDDDTLVVMAVTMMMVTLFHTGCPIGNHSIGILMQSAPTELTQRFIFFLG